MTVHPIRHRTDPVAQAEAEVERASAAVEATRKRVEEGADIAASLACAQYRLHGAMRRLEAAGSPPGGDHAA